MNQEVAYSRLTAKDKQITKLMLDGYSNTEISKLTGMKVRTIKGHNNKMFSMFGITDGIKRVKLAVILYRRELCENTLQKKEDLSTLENIGLSSWLLMEGKIVTSRKNLKQVSL